MGIQVDYKSIFISDLHLGLLESNADVAENFLRNNNFDNLYINGDIFDFWVMDHNPTWYDKNTSFLKTVLEFAKDNNKKVYYLSGNHDNEVLRFAGILDIHGIIISEEIIYKSLSGKKMLICHGHQVDYLISKNPSISRVASVAYNYLFYLDKPIKKIRNLMGKFSRWSLAGQVKNASKYKYEQSFEKLIIPYAKSKGCDGVICGHMHIPNLKEIDGLTYCNCGDIINSLTAIVEKLDGSFSLINL